ncbi:hypothetical protein [Phytoactinopolyspora limicola]|uniref:hypothetical protein n=1 Tax=Phytoactinopolyspora limicola TaxID=2715536 RepID=UPI00140DE740|nr:hypothetical protein [Phytoactinopolyspora limicola]
MRPPFAVIVAAVLVVTGCSGGDDHPDDTPESPQPGPRVDLIQQLLDDARFSETDIGLAIDISYRRESGLETATFAYCDDTSDVVDGARTARSQQWWKNELWPHVADGGYTVGVEVVHYEPGGALDTMSAFAAVPDTCPAADYASGASAVFAAAEAPAGLPEGAAALDDRWTYPDGSRASGFIVAVPVGDVIGFLYIRGHEPTVQQRVGELARLLATKVAAADEAIASLDPVT